MKNLMKNRAFRVRAAGMVQALLLVFLISQCGSPNREFGKGGAGSPSGGGAGKAGATSSATAGTAGHSGGASGRSGGAGDEGGEGGDNPNSNGGTAGFVNNGGGGGTDSAGTGPGGGGSSGSGGSAGATVGTACAANGDCALGNCIDGVCCESACTGCKACAGRLTGKSDGTCAPVVGGQDPHNQCADVTATNECGTDGACDGAGACRKVSSSHVCGAASCNGSTFKPVATCDGAGACSTPTTENCGAYPCTTSGCAKTCSSQADCSGTNYCKITSGTTGTCTAKNPNGTAATNTFECTSNIVADGVCCDKTCGGCMACSGAPLTGGAAGQCVNIVAGKVAHNACTASGKVCGLDGTCDGAGSCQSTPKQGESCDSASNKCSTGAKCQAGACMGGVATVCGPPPAKCQDAGVCNPSTGLCTYATSSNTTTCDDGNACTVTDLCTNGTCMGSPKTCAGAGQCKLASTCSAGTCSAQPNAQDGSTDTSCPSDKRICFSGSCVACNIDSHCVAPTPSCSNHACVCRKPSAANKLLNPGFDGSSSTGFTSWTKTNVVLAADIEGCPGSNSVFIENSENDPYQCFALPAGNFTMGGMFKAPPQTGSFVRIRYFTGANCTGGNSNTDDLSLNNTTTNWSLFWNNYTAPAGTVSARIGIYGIQLYADQIFVSNSAQF